MLFEEALRNKSLTQNELAVLAYITAHPHDATSLAVRELAEAAYVSPSAIMRLVKKLGFGSYGDMKIELARELAGSDAFADIDADYPELARASQAQVVSIVSSMEAGAIKKTEALLAAVDWRPILAAMQRASGVSLYGVGNSALACETFAENLRRLGLYVTLAADVSFAGNWAAMCPHDDLAILVSYTGNTPYALDQAATLRRRGVKSVSVTAEGENPLRAATTWSLPLALTERRFANDRMATFASSIETAYALDVLYAQFFNLDYAGNTRRAAASIERQGGRVQRNRDGSVTIQNER